MNNLQTWLQSSQDPTEVANKVKGLILGASALIVFGAASFFHITLTTDSVVTLASGVGMVAGAVWFVYGLFLHGVTALGRVR